MATQEMAINELEWRNAAVVAGAGQIISQVANHTMAGHLHLSVLTSLREVNGSMKSLLRELHRAPAIVALEAATSEQRSSLGEKMQDAHDKLRMMIATLNSRRLGYWQRFYVRILNTLEASNKELEAHFRALRDTESEMLLFSRKDQEILLEALLNPKEPSEDLYRIFVPK